MNKKTSRTLAFDVQTIIIPFTKITETICSWPPFLKNRSTKESFYDLIPAGILHDVPTCTRRRPVNQKTYPSSVRRGINHVPDELFIDFEFYPIYGEDEDFLLRRSSSTNFIL